MKLVKEHIYEKFVEDSDPVDDMGIGMMHIIKKWIYETTGFNPEGTKNYIWICAKHGKVEFVKFLIDAGVDIHKGNDLAVRRAVQNDHIEIVKLLLDAGAHTTFQEITLDLRGQKSLMNFAVSDRMKRLISKYIDLDEKFTEDSDPINDMGIGMEGIYKNMKPGNMFKLKKSLPSFNYVKGNCIFIFKVKKRGDEIDIKYNLYQNEYMMKGDLHGIGTGNSRSWSISLDFFKEYFEPIYINEKFTEDSDPIDDMDIGIIHQIKKYAEDKSPNNKKFFSDYREYLLWTCTVGNKIEYVKYLLKNGVRDNRNNSLCSAAEHGYNEILKMLLMQKGADVNAIEGYALRNALRNKYTETIKILIDAGADISLLNQSEQGMLSQILNEVFSEDSDPIEDMNIGEDHHYIFNIAIEDMEITFNTNTKKLITLIRKNIPSISENELDRFFAFTMHDIYNKIPDRFFETNNLKEIDNIIEYNVKDYSYSWMGMHSDNAMRTMMKRSI